MKVQVWKSEGESNERAISRFNKMVQGSRKLNLLRSRRYLVRPKTRRLVRAAAIMRAHYRGLREKKLFY